VTSPPLFTSRPPSVQAVLALGLPIVGGAIAGALLGISEAAYIIYSVLAIGAGYFGGLEHIGAEEGAVRGFCGGILFGTAILLVNELSGSDPKADLPDPEILLVVLTTVLGVGLGALGGRSRAKREARASAPG
jgi:hypothetical protein